MGGSVMGLRRAMILVAVAVLFLFVLSGPAAAADSWIALADEVSDTVFASDPDGTQATFPLSLAKELQATDVTVTLLSAARDGTDRDPAYAGAFPVACVDDNGIPIIQVKVGTSELTRTGIYTLTLRAVTAVRIPADSGLAGSGTTDPQVPDPEVLVVKVVIPPAVISTPSPVRLVVTRPFFRWWGVEHDVSAGSFGITETSGKSAVNLKPVTAASFADGNNEPVAVGIRLEPKPEKIEAGGTGTLNATLTADSPLGVSKGTVNLTSDQLGSAQAVTVEVFERISPWWIPIIVIVGVGVGFLVRHFLEKGIEFRQARRRGLLLLNEIHARTTRFEGPICEALLNVENELKRVLENDEAVRPNDTDAINTAITTARTGLDDALTKYRVELDRVAGLVTDVERTLDAPRAQGLTLPVFLKPEIDDARARLQTVRNLLKEEHPVGAEDELTRAMNTLAGNVFKSAVHWQDSYKELLESLRAGPLPKALRAELASDDPAPVEFSPDVKGDVDSLRENVADNVGKLVKAIEVAGSRLADAGNKILKEALAVERIVGQQVNAKPLARLVGDARGMCGLLPQAAADPDHLLGATGTALKNLGSDWEAALPGAPAKLVDEGSYVEAAMAIAPAAEEGLLQGGAPDYVFWTSSTISWYAPARTPPVQHLPDRIELAIQTNSRALCWLEGIWMGLIAALLAVAFWALMGDAFVGSWQQFLTIFFVAFAVDLTTFKIPAFFGSAFSLVE
jgi:hypothetical protein